MTSNDENFHLFLILLWVRPLISPVVSVSLDSIGLYVPQEDSLTRTFQVSNTGGSDLYWSIQSELVGLNDMKIVHQRRWLNLGQDGQVR